MTRPGESEAPMNRILEQLVSVLVILAGAWLLTQVLPGGRASAVHSDHLVWLSSAVTLSSCLVLLPRFESAAVNGLSGGTTFLILAGLEPTLQQQNVALAGVAAGTAILLFTLTAVTSLFCCYLHSRPVAAWATLLTAGLLASITLWTGTMVDVLAPSQLTINAIVAASPLTYLSSLAGWDYLRGEWFYRHTPFGGLRYDYPSALTSSLILIGTALVCELASSHLKKGSQSSLSSSFPQPQHRGEQACSIQ